MNSILGFRMAMVLFGSIASEVASHEVQPRLADSSESQRLRDLTLLRETSSVATTNSAALKEGDLKELLVKLQARIGAIDSKLRDSNHDEGSEARLVAERSKHLDRIATIKQMLSTTAAEVR